MRINLTFNDFEEMTEFCRKMAGEEEKEAPKKPKVKAKEEAKVEAKEDVQEDAKEEIKEDVQEQTPEEKPAEVSLEDVRAALGELQKSGKRAEVKELIKAFGCTKLTEIPADKYAEVLKKAGEI